MPQCLTRHLITPINSWKLHLPLIASCNKNMLKLGYLLLPFIASGKKRTRFPSVFILISTWKKFINLFSYVNKIFSRLFIHHQLPDSFACQLIVGKLFFVAMDDTKKGLKSTRGLLSQSGKRLLHFITNLLFIQCETLSRLHHLFSINIHFKNICR